MIIIIIAVIITIIIDNSKSNSNSNSNNNNNNNNNDYHDNSQNYMSDASEAASELGNFTSKLLRIRLHILRSFV